MKSRTRFNYGDFVRGFREACKQWEIDPLEGATAAQLVHVKVDQRRSAWKDDGWWHNPNLWRACPPYHSSAEEEAVWRLFEQSYTLLIERILGAINARHARDEWQELEAEMEKA
ncbi:MAG: hypothetical protein ABI835_18225 [Chloroflexota bacterium]